MARTTKDERVCFRVDDSLLEAFAVKASKEDKNVSEKLRDLMKRYVGRGAK